MSCFPDKDIEGPLATSQWNMVHYFRIFLKHIFLCFVCVFMKANLCYKNLPKKIKWLCNVLIFWQESKSKKQTTKKQIQY